jgi:3-phosphoshikimate 1-carboxyvinyltransferase
VLRKPLDSDDTAGFAEGRTALGYKLDRTPGPWQAEGHPQGPPRARARVSCRDGATTSRFLPALAAAGHGEFHFGASSQMRRRPPGPLTEALRSLGADLACEVEEGHHPITIRADRIKGGHITLDAGLSSQFLTALLLLGPLTAEGPAVTVTDLVPAPYARITTAMTERFGVPAERDGGTYLVPSRDYTATDYLIEPDASTASHFLAAAAPTGRSITVPGLGSHSPQGDLRFAEVLSGTGAGVTVTPESATVTGPANAGLRGTTVNTREISGTMPTLTAITPFASGPVRIEDVCNTRVKECDRLEARAQNLRALGVPVQAARDWTEVHPAQPRAAHISCQGDHRIAMAFSITGLRTPGITLDNPGRAKKTFPGFHTALAALQAAWQHDQ